MSGGGARLLAHVAAAGMAVVPRTTCGRWGVSGDRVGFGSGFSGALSCQHFASGGCHTAFDTLNSDDTDDGCAVVHEGRGHYPASPAFTHALLERRSCLGRIFGIREVDDKNYIAIRSLRPDQFSS